MYREPHPSHKCKSLAAASGAVVSFTRCARRNEIAMKQKRTISPVHSGWMILAIIVIIAVFISADWYYYYETRRSLDGEFGHRLATLAELVSASLAGDARELFRESPVESVLADTALAATLERIREAHAISNILIVREDGTTILSLRPGIYPAGDEYPHWHMDFPAIMSALEGTPAATKLFEASPGVLLKAGYAPMPPGSRRASAVVAVEASPAFLEGLNRLRLILIVVTGACILGIILFTVFAFRATGSLIKARESLMHAETLAAMGRMAAGVAHEIRNPLFIIRSSAEKLRDTCPGRAEEIESFLIEEVDRLNGILTDYLLFAKDEPTRRIPLDLATTLTRSLRNVRESIEGSGIELVTDFEIGEAPFFGEEKKLQQAFLNILLNARQSIAGMGRIRVTLASNGRHYVIRIEDTGRGIAERDMARIFEPFFTTKANGSGLGLSITKKVIEDHGGGIGVTSAVETGTVVTIMLPVSRPKRTETIEGDEHTRGADKNHGA
jgi:signal transduction histidine kinase